MLDPEDNVWFVAKDVALVVGYQNTRKAIKDHCEEARDGVTIRDSIGRPQKPTIIPRHDVYRLIVTSKLPSAQKFEKWMWEVIDDMLDYGGYIKDLTASAFNGLPSLANLPKF
ncbi:MAG: BRO family protein [Desulfovermiculus sp.]|nr:BRO family protein [Desulfovermiculus sp.]